jgi:hypothetical protein
MLTINPQGLPGVQGDLLMVLDSRAQVAGADSLARMLDRYTPNRNQFVQDASPATGGVFLTGELEQPDFNLNKPLTSVTWPRDIPYKTGGGFIDYTSNFFVDYGTAGANQYGLMGVDTNNLPTIQQNITKDLYPVNRFGYIVKVPLISQARMQMVGRSIEDILQDGLRLNYDKMLDQNGYLGLPNIGVLGLVNQPTALNSLGNGSVVYRTNAPTTGAGSSRKWADKTPDQILSEFNDLLNTVWANAQYDDSGMPNHVLLPPAVFANLNTRLISTAGSASILTYLKDNNIAKARGINLEIVPCRQCIDAGTALVSGETTSGRMVAYRNDIKKLHFDETVPLTRLITQPSAEQVAYINTYVASVGVLKILYFQTIAYLDGIS